jgi:hypothetical protein
MIYIRVEDKSEGRRSVPQSHKLKELRKEGDRAIITILADDLYSFVGSCEGRIIAGESQAPLNDDDLCRAASDYDRSGLVENHNILAFVVIDPDTGRIRIFRNFSGIRPVYFHQGDGVFIYASHVGLLRNDVGGLEIDDSAVPEQLVYRFLMPPRTIFRGISSLPSGWALDSDPLTGMEPSLVSRWSLGERRAGGRVADALEEVERILRRTTAEIKKTAVPVTLLLSGGLDSSILGAVCRAEDVPVESLSSGFHKVTGDDGESLYALSAAENLGFQHRVYDLSGIDYLFSLVDSILEAEEPIHHLQSGILGALFRNGLGAQSRYVINGQAADVVFGGGVFPILWRTRHIIRLLGTFWGRAIARPILLPFSRRDARVAFLLSDYSPSLDRENHFFWSLEAWGDIGWVRTHFGVGLSAVINGRRSFLEKFGSWDFMDKTALMLFSGDTDATMRIWNKLGEACGRIVLFPYSNPELVSYLFTLDWGTKAETPKLLLAGLARRLGLPSDIATRPKRSFGFPAKFWALPGGLFQPLVDMAAGDFDPMELQSLQTMESSKAMTLWGLLNLYLAKQMLVRQISPDDIKKEIVSRRATAQAN